MQLAFYKGPATDWRHRVGHAVTCWFTNSKYSHVELVVNGTFCSASSRDGGVRRKDIDLSSGKWDVIDIHGDVAAAWDWFTKADGCAYDWAGIARFGLPFLPQGATQWFCSEAVAAALGLHKPEDWTPGDLYRFFS